ncbi:MAG: hypothetical protein QM755_22535 [Luteolibacter sp.]
MNKLPNDPSQFHETDGTDHSGSHVAFLFSSSCFALAEEEGLLSLPRLTTRALKVYHEVRIVEKRPDGVTIQHEEGVARIPYEMLPDEVVRAVGGFNQESALEYRTEDRKIQAACEEQLARELQVLAEHRRIAWLDQQRVISEWSARAAARTRINPLHETPRSVASSPVVYASSGGSSSESEEIEVPVTTSSSSSSYCEPSCPPPPPQPPCPPPTFKPCGTEDPPPKPPYKPCGTDDPPPKPPAPPQPSSPPSAPSGSSSSSNSTVQIPGTGGGFPRR